MTFAKLMLPCLIPTLVLVFSITLNPSRSTATKLGGDEIFSRNKNAIVRINTLQQGVQVSHGTGFFISNDGLLLTNRHVIDNVLTGVGFSLEFETIDHKKTTKYLISECSYQRNLDLCVLKLPVRPSAWIPIQKATFNPGQKVFVIGHPSGFDFSISDGLLSGVRKLSMSGRNVAAPLSVEQIQVSAPISPGNSGGPILNDTGHLLGISTWIRTGKNEQNLNFGLSVNEIIPHIAKPKFETIEAKRAAYSLNDKALVREFKSKITEPAFKQFEKAENSKVKTRPALDSAQFGTFSFDAFSRKYAVDLPLSFASGCELVDKNPDAVTYRCYDLQFREGFSQFKIQKRFSDLYKKLNGKFLPPVPLTVVSNLKKAGLWEERAKNLTPHQLKYLSSIQAAPIKCKMNETSATYTLFDYTQSCTLQIYNDSMPGWSSVTSLYDLPALDIGVEITSTAFNPQLSYIYFSVGNIAGLSFRRLN